LKQEVSQSWNTYQSLLLSFKKKGFMDMIRSRALAEIGQSLLFENVSERPPPTSGSAVSMFLIVELTG